MVDGSIHDVDAIDSKLRTNRHMGTIILLDEAIAGPHQELANHTAAA
jgi:hypothetical protein